METYLRNRVGEPGGLPDSALSALANYNLAIQTKELLLEKTIIERLLS